MMGAHAIDLRGVAVLAPSVWSECPPGFADAAEEQRYHAASLAPFREEAIAIVKRQRAAASAAAHATRLRHARAARACPPACRRRRRARRTRSCSRANAPPGGGDDGSGTAVSLALAAGPINDRGRALERLGRALTPSEKGSMHRVSPFASTATPPTTTTSESHDTRALVQRWLAGERLEDLFDEVPAGGEMKLLCGIGLELAHRRPLRRSWRGRGKEAT